MILKKATSDTFTVKFEQDLKNNSTFVNTTRYGKTRQEMLLTSPFNFDATVKYLLIEECMLNGKKMNYLQNQSNIRTEFKTGALLHNISTGIEISKENQLQKVLLLKQHK